MLLLFELELRLTPSLKLSHCGMLDVDAEGRRGMFILWYRDFLLRPY